MVSNVDLAVVVHFRFFNFVKCIEHQFLKDLNTWTLIALLEEAVWVRSKIKKHHVFNVLVCVLLSTQIDIYQSFKTTPTSHM